MSASCNLGNSWLTHLRYFQHKVRVSSSTFDAITALIQDNPIFHNNSNNPQIDVWLQLAITLNRFGHYGNAATTEDIGEWAGVSSGTVDNATKRVVIALLALHDRYVRMPTDAETTCSKEFCSDKTRCPRWADGFLSVDGTTIPIFQKPGHYGEAYFDKSSRYSLNVQVSTNVATPFL